MFTSGNPDLQSLMQLLDAARMGWWKADFRTGELLFSDYVVNLLGLGSNRAAVGELMPLTREDYRKRIHNEFLSLKVGNHFDETFPLVLPEGEVWIHAQLVRKQSDSQQGIKLFGYLQRVPVADRKEADILTLESNYYATLRENKHMDELLDHLPIGYFRIRLLYDDNGRATDYLFLSVNQTAQQILGVDAADYLDKTAREIDLPVDQHIDELAAIGLGDYKMDQWHAAKTGRYCRSFLYNTPNDATEIVILILDITDVVTAHQALDEKEKLLRNVIQNAPIGIEIYDRTGHLVDINARDLEMFGVTDPAGIRGLSIFDNPNFSAEIKDCIREGRGTDFTTRYDFSKARSYYDTSRSGYIDWTAASGVSTTTRAKSPTTCSSTSTTRNSARRRTGSRNSKRCSVSSPNTRRWDTPTTTSATKRVMRRASGCATTANPIRPTSATSSENTAASTPTTARNCCTGWRSSSPGRYSRHRSPAASCTTTAGRHGSRATSSAATTGRRSR